jgi:putative ABC transport system permease protein
MKLQIYIKQAVQLMKQNRFYTAVYILGTALSISLVMVIAIVYHIKTANIKPEVNRSRMLLVDRAQAKKKDGQGTTNWNLSYRSLQECFYNLENPECITAFPDFNFLKYYISDVYVARPGSRDKYVVLPGPVDANFWKVFRFNFKQGQPFSEGDFNSGIFRAVLSERLARKLFGSDNAVGQNILFNEITYTVSGVVEDVSPSMTMTYADVWVPYTTIPIIHQSERNENIVGMFVACILAHSPKDFDKIRAEIQDNVKKYNSTFVEWEYVLQDEVALTPQQLVIQSLDNRSSYNEIILRYLLVALLFLLVPSVNLSGLTSSRMQERISEIGIRKAFGASRLTLINQALTENLTLTLLGGLVGLVFSWLIIGTTARLLLIGRYSSVGTEGIFKAEMLFSPTVFFYGLCVCIILNLLSSIIPVWNASRKNIVDSINDK